MQMFSDEEAIVELGSENCPKFMEVNDTFNLSSCLPNIFG